MVDIDQNGNYSTIGIESPDQDDGVQYLFSSNIQEGSFWVPNTEGFYENIAIKFTTGSQLCGQLDVSGDGIVNVIDIISLVNIVISQQQPDSQGLCGTDVNSDGIINVLDIIELVNYIIS